LRIMPSTRYIYGPLGFDFLTAAALQAARYNAHTD